MAVFRHSARLGGFASIPIVACSSIKSLILCVLRNHAVRSFAQVFSLPATPEKTMLADRFEHLLQTLQATFEGITEPTTEHNKVFVAAKANIRFAHGLARVRRPFRDDILNVAMSYTVDVVSDEFAATRTDEFKRNLAAIMK